MLPKISLDIMDNNIITEEKSSHKEDSSPNTSKAHKTGAKVSGVTNTSRVKQPGSTNNEAVDMQKE